MTSASPVGENQPNTTDFENREKSRSRNHGEQIETQEKDSVLENDNPNDNLMTPAPLKASVKLETE